MVEVTPAGQVLEKTTRTRIISESQAPEFWEYLERQNLPDPDHLLYLYLQRDNRNLPYGQYTSHFPTGTGRLIDITDREAFEQAIQARFGGGVWRLILKKGKERKCETRVFTGDGPTLPPPTEASELRPMQGNTSPNPFAHLPNVEGGAAQIANKAIDVLAGQEHQAVNLGLGMMTTAADVMRRFAEKTTADAQAPPAAGPEADLRNALTQAMVARLAMDPLQQFSQMFAFFRELNGSNGNGNGVPSIGQRMDEFRSVMSLAREFLGTTPAAASVAGTGAAIVNVLPGIVSAGVDIARAWQVGKEAERDAVLAATQQGRPGNGAAVPIAQNRSPFFPPPRPVLPPPQTPQVNPTPTPAPVAAPAPGPAPGAIVPPSTEFIEMKLVELIRAPVPVEEAASRALDFLHTLSGANPAVSYVTQLIVLGETGLVNLFHMRPNLKPATQDMARLLEFIRSFLKQNADDEAEEAKLQKPN